MGDPIVRKSGLSAIVTTVCLASMIASGQVIQRPGFEGDPVTPAPWVEYGDAVTSDPSDNARVYRPPTFGISEAKEGTYIYGAARDGSAMRGGVRQTISGFSAGTLYAVTVWIYTARVGNGSGIGTIGVDPVGGINPSGLNVIYLPGVRSDNTWTQVLLPFVAVGPNVTIFLDYALGGGGFSIVYFDLVELQVNPDLSTACPLQAGTTVQLRGCRVDLNEGPEAMITVPAGHVITGLGFRAWFQDVVTIRVQSRELRPDGTLGTPVERRGGIEPSGGLEVNVTVPDCHVIVGFGARASAETDITTMAVWARPLLPDGTLGDVVELRAGSDPNHALERQHQITGNRALTGAGMRVGNGDVTGLYLESCALEATGGEPARTSIVELR